MLFNRVTITGADDAVDIGDLVELTNRYPFVEWGILLHETKQGQPRYPLTDWLTAVCKSKLPLSGHLCGRWARRTCKNEWLFQEAYSHLADKFSRWQLNISPYYQTIKDEYAFIDHMPFNSDVQVIFQFYCDPVKWVFPTVIGRAWAAGKNVAMLWDGSGGKGILPNAYPHFGIQPPTGIAGGLTPDNLETQIVSMSLAVRDKDPIWIDVESGVRTNNMFDLDKVGAFLQTSSKWVM